MMLLCVKEQFSAAHKLPGHPKCSRTHGHNYTVIVKVEVPYKPESFGERIKLDFGKLKEDLKSTLEKLDHKNINSIIQYPTAENIAKLIHLSLSSFYSIREVKVYETDKYWVELKP